MKSKKTFEKQDKELEEQNKQLLERLRHLVREHDKLPLEEQLKHAREAFDVYGFGNKKRNMQIYG